MPGKAEGGAVPPASQPAKSSCLGKLLHIRKAVGRDPSRPPLSCRTSPPRGGRLAVTRPFANLQRTYTRGEGEVVIRPA
ncbi:hypothetical protein CK219_25775 [Mesorhizobium sp. WSM4313]|nr:hypothetical protein CK219_25775 [Mesorhizobium sp. WSM4313]